MAKFDYSARIFETAGKTIAGKTTSHRGVKLVQYAAAREWANKKWASAYKLYSAIPEEQRSVAVLERLLVLVNKLDLSQDKESICAGFVADYRSVEELVVGIGVAKKHREAELQESISQRLREKVAATGGLTPELFSMIHRGDPAWHRLEVLIAQRDKQPLDYSWHKLIADVAWNLRDYNLVIDSLQRLEPQEIASTRFKYLLAESNRRLGNVDDAKAYYREYQSSLPKGKQFKTAIKEVRKSEGDFAALEILSSGLLDSNNSGAVIAEKAEIEERLHAYAEAKRLYSELAFLKRDEPRMSYKVGLNAERSGEYGLAALAYADALDKNPNQLGNWYSYRLGYVFWRERKYQLAAEAFASYFKLQPEEKKEKWGFERAITTLFRSGSHRSLQELVRYRTAFEGYSNASIENNYRLIPLGQTSIRLRLAEIAMQRGSFEIASNILRLGELFSHKDGMRPESYRKSVGNKRNTYYVECLEQCEINPQLILWESNHGSSVGCHPLAQFREFVSKYAVGEFTHVWAINDLAAVPQDVKDNPDVVLVPLHSDDYLYALATAKYLVNNVTFAPYFVRRVGQLYLNTWHGTPYKTLGKSMRQGVLEYENIQRNFIQSTHLLAPNELTRWALIDDHGIDDIYAGKVVLAGSPRLDTSLNMSQAERCALRAKLGVKSDQEKIVLFAPTWRGGVSERELDVEELVADLKALDSAGAAKIVFRAHRLSEKLLENVNIPVTVVPAEIDTNELLAAIDVLVTDYSSILFDFLPQKKPVVLYQHDLDEYKSQRGVYLDSKEVPGAKVYEREDLPAAVLKALDGKFAPNPDHLSRFCPFEDGHASARVNSSFFAGVDLGDDKVIDYKEVQARKKTKSIVWHASLIPNGIASAGIALLEKIPSDEFVINFIVEPRTLRANPERLEQFKKLPDNVRIICRTVLLPRSIAMMRDVATFKKIEAFPNQSFKEAYFSAFHLERRRLFSDFLPDYVVEYDGYADFWLSLLASWGELGVPTVCYQHNQMYEEMIRKDPSLNRTFALYPMFTRLIAVSAALAEHNERSLSSYIEETPVVQTFARNLINVDSIIELADRVEDVTPVIEFMDRFETTFISVGRLSTEKNQETLIKAFAELVGEGNRVGLVIVGSGILEEQLKQEINRLGLENQVLLTGQLSNPYPAIRHADCFILPSKHEGQPVTLLEAMALGMPVITTTLPGCIEVVGLGYGKLTETDQSSVANAMREFLGDRTAASGVFDAKAYCDMALGENLRAITD